MRLSQLHPNEGQIKGVPNNPRKITEPEFQEHKKSIKDSREFLVARPIIVDEEWNILGGNMRYRACCALRDEGAKTKDFKFTDVIPDEWVKIVHWTMKKKREFVLKDNESNGETDFLLLAEWDNMELSDWGIDGASILPAFEAEDLGSSEDEEQKQDSADFNGEQKPSTMQFETVKQKRKQLWGKGHVSDAATDLKEIFYAHFLRDGGYMTIYRKSKDGIRLVDIKSPEHKEYVEVFAQSAYKILKATITIGNPKNMCIITTPKRRHKDGYHFATEVCKRLSELTGIRFEDDVVTANNRKRINPTFTKAKEPPEDTYVLYDDIITTGNTIMATKSCFPNKNIVTIVNVMNLGAIQ